LPVITTFCHAHSADRRRGRRAGSLLQDIMSKDLSVTTPDASLAELKAEFGAVSGLPVVKDRSSMVLVGVVSRKDLLKAGGTVADVRTQPRKPCPFLRNG
jgi:CBS-domain-containing membrane protein